MIDLLAGVRQYNESLKAVQACNDYLRMGPGRTLAQLHREYDKTPKNQTQQPATRSYQTLWGWSNQFNWSIRAETYDTEPERRKTERAKEIMETGLALAHERVDKLKALAAFLEGEIYNQDEDGDFYNIWLEDVKQIGRGEDAERVDLVRFNKPLIEQYRGAMDDIAKEMGARQGEAANVEVNLFDIDEWKAKAKAARQHVAQLEKPECADPNL